MKRKNFKCLIAGPLLMILSLWAGPSLADYGYGYPNLIGASVAFHTTNENKDYDTHVSVSVVCGGQTVGYVSGTFGEFCKGNHTGWIGLGLYQYPTKMDVSNYCYASLVEAPVGHDEWHFEMTLVLNFSDGTFNNYVFPGNVDHDRTTMERDL